MSPPDKPRRGYPGGLIEVQAPAAPHTPVPPPLNDAPTAPPPKPDRRAPPPALRGPRVALPPLEAPLLRAERDEGERTTVGLGPTSVSPARRPTPVNPPPPASMRTPMPSVPEGHVTVGKGKWTLTMPSVVALALIASVGGFATAWLNKPSPGDPSVIAKAIRDEMASQKTEQAKQYESLLKRVDDGETRSDRLQSSIDAVLALHLGDRIAAVELKVDRVQQSQDALRDRVNDLK